MPSRITQQLVKECRRNPKKAAMLGVLSLVAMWFWAPLVMGLFGADQSTSAKPSAATAPAAAQPVASATQPALANKPAASAVASKFDWKEIAESIQGDPLMRPLALAPTRNPFVSDEAVANDAPPEAEPVAEAPKAKEPPDPQTAGLKLTGTSVGGSRPMALINGRPYGLGRVVLGEGDSAFEVVRIEAARVILRRDGKLFELQAERRRDNPSLSIRRSQH